MQEPSDVCHNSAGVGVHHPTPICTVEVGQLVLPSVHCTLWIGQAPQEQGVHSSAVVNLRPSGYEKKKEKYAATPQE